MRGVFMEKIIKMKRSKLPVLLIIVAVVALAALAFGIYYLVNNRNKEPSRGTYVIEQKMEGFGYEKTYK